MIPKLFRKIIKLDGKQSTFPVSVSLYMGIFLQEMIPVVHVDEMLNLPTPVHE